MAIFYSIWVHDRDYSEYKHAEQNLKAFIIDKAFNDPLKAERA
jgi:hypothetical protein